MIGRRTKILVILSLLFFSGFSKTHAQWKIDLETGAVFSGYNNVRIPGDTGTKLSFSRDLKTDLSYFFRFRLWYQFHSGHNISLLYAPLSLKASGRVDKPVRFTEEEFPPNIPLHGVYRFNSYRLTYRYDFIRKKNFRAGLGITAKIRDAAVSLEGNNKKAEKTNVGFVPLINLRVEWLPAKKIGFLLEGDMLAAPQGRAEDVFVGLQFPVSKSVNLKAGYRFIEGGADVAEVYNFAFLNFIVIGTVITF
ncbi:MAG: hypothetical protein ACETWK_14055 [Candidatus Aminicenantaceae bacterium]